MPIRFQKTKAGSFTVDFGGDTSQTIDTQFNYFQNRGAIIDTRNFEVVDSDNLRMVPGNGVGGDEPANAAFYRRKDTSELRLGYQANVGGTGWSGGSIQVATNGRVGSLLRLRNDKVVVAYIINAGSPGVAFKIYNWDGSAWVEDVGQVIVDNEPGYGVWAVQLKNDNILIAYSADTDGGGCKFKVYTLAGAYVADSFTVVGNDGDTQVNLNQNAVKAAVDSNGNIFITYFAGNVGGDEDWRYAIFDENLNRTLASGGGTSTGTGGTGTGTGTGT